MQCWKKLWGGGGRQSLVFTRTKSLEANYQLQCQCTLSIDNVERHALWKGKGCALWQSVSSRARVQRMLENWSLIWIWEGGYWNTKGFVTKVWTNAAVLLQQTDSRQTCTSQNKGLFTAHQQTKRWQEKAGMGCCPCKTCCCTPHCCIAMWNTAQSSRLFTARSTIRQKKSTLGLWSRWKKPTTLKSKALLVEVFKLLGNSGYGKLIEALYWQTNMIYQLAKQRMHEFYYNFLDR